MEWLTFMQLLQMGNIWRAPTINTLFIHIIIYFKKGIELKSADNKFCDLQIDSDKIIFLSDMV